MAKTMIVLVTPKLFSKLVDCRSNCLCPNSTEINNDESCEDDANGNCELFRPYCDQFTSYANRHCSQTCGLCPTETQQCECGKIDEPKSFALISFCTNV